MRKWNAFARALLSKKRPQEYLDVLNHRGVCDRNNLEYSESACWLEPPPRPNPDRCQQLVGGQGSLGPGRTPIKTVGSFWPYATTLFDYVRRAMPLNEPKSLRDEEVYAVVAYILLLNGVIGENDTIDAQTLPAVRMPNLDRFVRFSRGK